MNHTSTAVKDEPTEGTIVLADCANFGHVIDGNHDRHKVAVPYNYRLIERKEHESGFRIRSTPVYDFDLECGTGCDSCLGTGQIAVYRDTDNSPYYRMKACPDCSSPTDE